MVRVTSAPGDAIPAGPRSPGPAALRAIETASSHVIVVSSCGGVIVGHAFGGCHVPIHHVEGSTRRWEADADGMRVALTAHDTVLRTVIDAHGGCLFKHTGDGVCAAFASPRGRGGCGGRCATGDGVAGPDGHRHRRSRTTWRRLLRHGAESCGAGDGGRVPTSSTRPSSPKTTTGASRFSSRQRKDPRTIGVRGSLRATGVRRRVLRARPRCARERPP